MSAKFIFLLLIGVVILLALARGIVLAKTAQWIYRPEEVTADRVAIVFGAGLQGDGRPSPVLRDRVKTAAELFFSGKVEKLLMSGAIRFLSYNEPGAMREYALTLGVPEEAIVLDYAGRRTYDTCYRAKEIFRLESAILVTQRYHLPRALYICQQLGLLAEGVTADLRRYQRGPYIFWNLREVFASAVALWEVHLTHPTPVLGEPEPIFSNTETPKATDTGDKT